LFAFLAEQSRQVIENTGDVSTGDRPSETPIGLGRTVRSGQRVRTGRFPHWAAVTQSMKKSRLAIQDQAHATHILVKNKATKLLKIQRSVPKSNKTIPISDGF